MERHRFFSRKNDVKRNCRPFRSTISPQLIAWSRARNGLRVRFRAWISNHTFVPAEAGDDGGGLQDANFGLTRRKGQECEAQRARNDRHT